MPAESKSQVSGPPTRDGVMRILIPSTFRDMMRERDLLEVVPELRQK